MVNWRNVIINIVILVPCAALAIVVLILTVPQEICEQHNPLILLALGCTGGFIGSMVQRKWPFTTPRPKALRKS